MAKAIKEKYPDAQLVIAADNDHKLRKNVEAGSLKAALDELASAECHA